MKGRSFAIVSWCTLSIWLQAGCAGNQIPPDRLDSGNRPQLLIPGAIRSDVKGLAMGSARARGWTIVKSTDDLLVMQRPLDPSSPSTLTLGTIKSAGPPVIEVTSVFVEQSGGVNVALGAALITQPPDEKSPTRVDYTEHYRNALAQSLESLRSSWTANRQRVANAMPTQSSHSEPPPAAAAGTDAENNRPLVQESEQTVADEASVTGETTADPNPTPAPTRTPAEPRLAPSPAATPTPTPEPVAPEDNMLTLNQSSETGVWAYDAEQYARLHGCNVTDAGAQLIDSRVDGEIHKVSCVGADSYLLKCQNGVCRSLN